MFMKDLEDKNYWIIDGDTFLRLFDKNALLEEKVLRSSQTPIVNREQ